MIKRILATIAGALLVPAAALIGVAWWILRDVDEEMIGKSPAEMARRTSLPFPSDASGIHYFSHVGGMQDLKRFGKFDCPAKRADAIMADFIAHNDRELQRPTTLAARRTVVTPPFETVGSGDFKLRWWDLDERKVRKAILLNESYVMQFWTEPSGSDGATIYFRVGD